MEADASSIPGVKAWREAGEKLGVRVVAPYRFTVHGEEVECAVHLPDFGGPNGMVVLVVESLDGNASGVFMAKAKRAGFWCSVLMRDGYDAFHETNFKDTLDDWGYYGAAENKPAWYSGKPWT